MSRTASFVSRKPTVLSRKASFVSRKASFVSRKASLVSRKPTALSRKASLVSRKPTVLSRKASLVSRKVGVVPAVRSSAPAAQDGSIPVGGRAIANTVPRAEGPVRWGAAREAEALEVAAGRGGFRRSPILERTLGREPGSWGRLAPSVLAVPNRNA